MNFSAMKNRYIGPKRYMKKLRQRYIVHLQGLDASFRAQVWIAAVGRTEADKQDALEASRLIWVDVALSDVPNDHGSVREQTVGATLGD